MGTYSFKLPDLGEGVVESEIVEWYVQPGDQVVEDQRLADVMTDKATVEVSSPVSGKVLTIACLAGEILPVGSELASFDISEQEQQVDSVTDDLVSQPLETKRDARVIQEVEGKALSGSIENQVASKQTNAAQIVASPSLRRRALREGIDLALVTGSGPAGRISHRDFDGYLACQNHVLSETKTDLSDSEFKSVKLTGLRRVIAAKMQKTKRNVPHYSYVEEVDVTELETLRQFLNRERDEHQHKLTLLPFVMLAITKVVEDFPNCNARYDDQTNTLQQFKVVNIGIATATEPGLMVPVVFNCEKLDLWQCASEVVKVSGSARIGNIKPEELQGSTITITSLGALGGLVTTPVINAPETAIVGVNKMQWRPVIRNGAVEVRQMMNLSLSFDHRIVDGHEGARFAQAVKQLLENPSAIFVPKVGKT
ncbi:Lipoamide acyltransferase component of branched-chain alpha-keto acid dehydrogenase complex [Vibrio nigripulchritudo SFn27]|uniref:Dihydrolipoamide acetyltransferase component of pyruvate dehydrogenase complex n=1 Tax=Vibrio nigripulchritudo TaxID=28173 RepID=U4K3I0_9VIBR|nr:dihydrolipoamide acetyltransferase family protein [Vibrio nigripulchritudo]CCN83806.1 Lipoamide acyltransferase component of branched-chain alpha-keto acid dehydrogenase complex [Vibrio nigripulchritudo BLFn1]CCN87186.1 Lipoamide acyltransferase component of branched-chain alpha-keto acid dehydrogenase complex [Vibrio nigripulchritudo SFn27]CCN94542.1 Lipoamide acyltransferase component of branched-chain alpha-keto acid dehydrogenase complex [Vibrio nigripulchritudo ENn2]CCO40892.1 Lipoamide